MCLTDLFAAVDLWTVRVPIPLALALVALLGYLIGRRARVPSSVSEQQSRRELRRAQLVAAELERIALAVRANLSKHQSSLGHFKERVSKLNSDKDLAAWKDLCREAEEILKPTLRLATQMADAYDQIRHQSAQLMAFTEIRTDPLTGVSNRRALDEAIKSQFALMTRYHSSFSIAIFDIDHFKQVNDEHGHLHGDRILQDVAKLLDDTVRETDIVARYGGEEFVVVMPHTPLEGACIFAERLRARVEQQLPVTISGGVSAAMEGDTAETLVARADAALYRAKTAGRNSVFWHTGSQIEAVAKLAAEPAHV